jgi:hypothetical protein
MGHQVKEIRAAIVRESPQEQVVEVQVESVQTLLLTHQAMVEQVYHHQLLVQP